MALWDRPKLSGINRVAFCLHVAMAVFVLASCAVALKWWILSALALSALVLIGEEAIMSWLFFISVSGGVVWLFCKFALGIEL